MPTKNIKKVPRPQESYKAPVNKDNKKDAKISQKIMKLKFMQKKNEAQMRAQEEKKEEQKLMNFQQEDEQEEQQNVIQDEEEQIEKEIEAGNHENANKEKMWSMAFSLENLIKSKAQNNIYKNVKKISNSTAALLNDPSKISEKDSAEPCENRQNTIKGRGVFLSSVD